MRPGLRCGARRGIALGVALLLGGLGPAAGQVKQVVEQPGTVALGSEPDRVVTVEATYEEAPETPKVAWKRTLTRLRFRSKAGRLLYQETFETKFGIDAGFDLELSVGPAIELRGTARRFLLLPYNVEPSAPSGGTSFLVYGFDRSGGFRRVSVIEGSGEVIRNPKTAGSNLILMREGKYLDVSRWTSHFTLILPYEFKEDRGGFDLTGLCGKVETDPQPPAETAVVLYPGPAPGGQTKTVKVTRASKIQFLDGCLGYSSMRADEYIPWIHVRVDGQEGWVPNEKTDALGLLEAD